MYWCVLIIGTETEIALSKTSWMLKRTSTQFADFAKVDIFILKEQI